MTLIHVEHGFWSQLQLYMLAATSLFREPFAPNFSLGSHKCNELKLYNLIRSNALLIWHLFNIPAPGFTKQ